MGVFCQNIDGIVWLVFFSLEYTSSCNILEVI